MGVWASTLGPQRIKNVLMIARVCSWFREENTELGRTWGIQENNTIFKLYLSLVVGGDVRLGKKIIHTRKLEDSFWELALDSHHEF